MNTKKDTPSGDGTPPSPGAKPEPAEAAAAAAGPGDVPGDDATITAADLERNRHASTVIRNNVYLAAAAGVIPFSYVDTAALMAVQVKMLRELSEVYGVTFRGDISRSAIGVLLASVAPKALAGGILGSGLLHMALSSMPVVSAGVRFVTMPAFGSAFTYALGKVFQMHFASGGTFLTFDATAVKEYFINTYNAVRNRKPEAAAA